MKKTLSLVAAILLSGCAGTHRTEAPQTSEGSLQSDAEVLKQAGMTLAGYEFQIPAFRVVQVSTSAKFTQVVETMPGDDMRSAYRPAKLSAGDILIGVNTSIVQHNNVNEFYENKILRAYASKSSFSPLHFLDGKTGEVKNILSNDGHSLEDLTFRPEYVQIKGTVVSSVTPGNWADRHGIKEEDLLIGNVKLISVATRRSWMKFAPHKRRVSPLEVSNSTDTERVTNLLASVFRQRKPYRPTSKEKDGVMGHASLMNLMILREKEKKSLIPLSLTHTRYVGLGLQFDCTPYCGRAAPVIKAMFPQSSGARAGFKLEDLLITVNGKKVYSSWQAVQIIRKLNYGETLTLRVLRNKEVLDVPVKVEWVFED